MTSSTNLSAITAPAAPAEHIALIHRDLPAWRLVLFLAWPAWLQQFLNLLVSLSDRYLAGRVHGDTGVEHAAQAAQTSAFYITWLISCYTVLVSVGSTAIVARMIGAGDRAGAVRTANQSIVLALILGLLGSGAALAGLPAMLRLLELHGAAAELAAAYFKPLFVLLVFQVIEAAGIACLVGAGDTRTGLVVLGCVAAINALLAWLFFHGLGPVPALGFAGIALGTALSHTLGALGILYVLARGRAGLQLELRLLTPDWTLLYRLLRVSIPAAADSLSVAMGQLWFLRIVNQLGDVAAAAHGIALGWEALGFLSGAAFGTAAMTLVSQNLGARRPNEAARSAWTAFYLGMGVMALMGVLFFAFAPAMFQLFCPQADQIDIVAAGVPVLRLVAFAMPALASCIIFTSALRGAGDTRVPVLFTWLGFFFVRIPLAYWLTRKTIDLNFVGLGIYAGWNLGLIGAWWAMLADIFVRGAFFLARFSSGRWRTMEV